MKIFLIIKHWQMFLIWILGSIQMKIFMKTDFLFFSFALYIGLIFSWIYSIGKILNENNTKITRKLNIWSIAYLIAMIPFAIKFHDMMSQSYEQINTLFILVGGIIGLVSIINIGIISAKSIREKENKGNLTFNNYALEFFLILYMVIGVWILQPRLNKIMAEKNTTGNNGYK